jgi:protocatechuate 3,4-dioxygenase beta subunit
MKKFINLLLISFILLSLTAVTGANAAGTTFSVSGKVLDRLGSPVPGADVTLIDFNYKVIRAMKTTDTGNFDFINVVAETDTCTVRISYTGSDGTKYETPSYFVRWYPTKGMVFIPEKETVIPRYPPPIYGYIYGAIQTDMSMSGQFINGIVYLESLDNGVKYYMFADRTDGKGSYQFYAPAGPYMLYAQHWENGVVYQSSLKQVSIKPNTDVTEVLETRIILPLNSPANDPDPSMMPEHSNNKVNGSVVTKDGKPWPGATVTLLQKADNGTGFIPMKGSDSKPTDASGNYEFYGVSPTSDDGKSVQSKKDVKVMVEYTDASGNKQAITAESRDARPLYYPDMIMGYGAENAARSISLPPVTLPFAKGGWVSLNSVPTGAFIYVDDQQLFGPNNQPLQTPCTAYIDPGDHSIKMAKEGYTDSVDSITMVANTEHPEFIMSLQKAIVPPWVTAAVAVIILLIVVILVVVLLATRIKFLLAPFGKIFGGLGHKWGDYKANRDISKAHKAEVAEQKSMERKRIAEEKMAARRESVSPTGGQARDDVHVVNVDPVRRKHDAGAADEGKKTFGGSKKKILDIDLKHIADSVPKKIKPKEEAKKERTPVVFANEIYKKANTDIERIPYESSTPRQSVSEREALVKRPTTPERGDRFRIPRTSGQREANSPGDRERVLKYIRDHPEGVSFIQMSNDLEIIPNNLTYITKELAINDDIEKVKGLYYFKSHASPAEDSSSSVVVWRLDGDK